MSQLSPPNRSTGQLRPGQLPALLVCAACYLGLAYYTPRAHFGQLLALFGLAFGTYAYLLRTGLPLRAGLVAALLLRLLWLPALPALSDDYHRFRWDGLLVAAGQNPYLHRPDEFLLPVAGCLLPVDSWNKEVKAARHSDQREKSRGLMMAGSKPQQAGLPRHARFLPLVEMTFSSFLPTPNNQKQTTNNQQLATEYPLLNSPHYYSVYPPVCQALFGAAAWLQPSSARGFVVWLRVVLLLAEAGSTALLLALLRRLGQPPARALWYLLNPLVIVELTGNIHFEALLICLWLLAIWLLGRGRGAWSAGVLGLAVGTKLLPVLMLPLLVRRLGWRRAVGYGAVAGATVAALFAPFVSVALVRNLGRSLELYFHSFEFNASVYYLLRAVGYYFKGYNIIATLGPALAATAAAAGLLLAYFERRPTLATLPRALLLFLTAYYLLATTVHPWYLTPLVALSVLTSYRYALVWSGLAVLSYAAYQTSAYIENLWLVGLEYGVVGVFLIKNYKVKSKG